MAKPAAVAPKAYHHGDLRKALLEAAELELIDKGMEGFSLRGVAKRAGVSHAAPAHHFRDTNALLTALCTVAAERFLHAMKARQALAAPEARSQFIASGLGYIDFALANPALFRLMFGSERPDSQDAELLRVRRESFMVLANDVGRIRGGDPFADDEARLDIAAAWGAAHGVATLLIAGRLAILEPLLQDDREDALRRLISRVLPRL